MQIVFNFLKNVELKITNDLEIRPHAQFKIASNVRGLKNAKLKLRNSVQTPKL